MNRVQRIFGRIREFFSIYSDTIVTSARTYTRRWRSAFKQPLNDWGRSDYAFWRRAYLGRAKGLELSGLFIKPLVNKIAAWVLGQAPKWKCDDEISQEALADWWAEHHAEILQAYRFAKKQGDCFLVINSDLSITIVPPDDVDPIVADDDFGNIVGWRVMQTLQHPDTLARMTVIDEYYPDRRIHIMQINGIESTRQTFPNLLGRLQIVHIANHVDDGQTFGHAEAEALLPLFHRYGEVIDAAIEGNVLQGRPTPVITFADLQAQQTFWSLYGSEETQTLPDGTTKRVMVLDIDLSQVLTITNGEFDYKTPGNFTDDTAKLLEILFYLILEHTELPEFVMGNAIASSKASADAQMPVFEKFIQGEQGEAKDWLTSIAEIVLAYLSLLQPGVVAQTPKLQWAKLTQDGRLTLDTVKWALESALLDRRTALMLSPAEVEDIDEVLEKAEEERIQRDTETLERAETEAQIAANNQPPRAVGEMDGDVIEQAERHLAEVIA